MSKKTRTRRTRRQANQALKWGVSAKPTHKGRAGRTGGMMKKIRQSAHRGKGSAKRAARAEVLERMA